MEAYFLPLAQTALTLAVVFNPDSKFISNYFSLRNIKNNSSQSLQNNDFKIDKKADSKLNFELLWQKSDEELKQKLSPEQLKNLALYISLKLMSDFGKNPLKSRSLEDFSDDKKANILQTLKRCSKLLEFSSKEQLIEKLKNFNNHEKINDDILQNLLSVAFLGFLTSAYQINKNNISPKNEAIKKFVDMIESSEVNKVFALTTSSKIKFLKNLINENNSFQAQSFVN
jgi:hypothetical protein